MIPSSRPGTRSGTVLIIVAGISALLASLTLAFLLTARNDLDEMGTMVSETQCRIMLTAACNYIQEASRIGWDTPLSTSGASTEHTETYGWIDVRNGELGPTATTGAPPVTNVNRPPQNPGSQGASNFPLTTPRRFPMYVMNQPPYAIQQTVCYNPVVQTDLNNPTPPYLRYPDPQPVTSNGWVQDPTKPGGTVSNANFATWAKGDRTPRQNSVGMSWFRLYRESTGAVFTVTCGSGGTLGYASWAEVTSDPNGGAAQFNNDPNLFQTLQQAEYRMWYRVEWSALTCSTDINYMLEGAEQQWVMSLHDYTAGGAQPSYSGGAMAPNMGGTIQWIERLANQPPDGQW